MLEPLPKVFLTRLAMTENFPKLPQMQWCLVCPSEGVWQGGKCWAIECLVNSKQHFATPHGPQLFGLARVHEPYYIWPGLGRQMRPDAWLQLNGERERLGVRCVAAAAM